MEKENNRRKFIVIANMGVGYLSTQVAQKLASISDSNTIVVVSPKEVAKYPERGVVFNLRPTEIVTDITTVINPHSTGGKHKGGKKNKRNKRW